MNNNIQIREYEEKDKTILLDFVNKLEEYQKGIDPIARVKNLDGFAEKYLEQTFTNLDKYSGKIFLAEVDSVIAGFISGVIFDQSEIDKLEVGGHKQGEILKIYITEEYRGKGLGKLMISKMEDFFKENGCDSVWIEVSSYNTNAHSTYEKLGFIDREVGMLKEI
jgi:ribosomal protein S18 acetylase RimI-like enzyme